MAESKNTKKTKTPESFSDDLDSMLNLDEAEEQQVGLIEDDDAIDRLLMGDAFAEETQDNELDDIDTLISENAAKDDISMADFDEFGDDADDFMPDFQIKPGVDKIITEDEVVPLADIDVEKDVELTNLESVGEIDEFGDDAPAMPDFKSEPISVNHDELEAMTEIDELSDDAARVSSEKADFLLADFDISADDEDEQKLEQVVPAEAEVALKSTQPQPAPFDEFSDDEFAAEAPTDTNASPASASVLASSDQRSRASDDNPDAVQSGLVASLSAELAELGTHLNELKRQHQQLKQQIQLKGNQEELHDCQESVDVLKTEQKKLKRGLDTLDHKKPVSAYVANVIASIALIVGGSLGFQGYVAKVQLGQLVEFVGKLQAQVNAGPTADAAEKEMLRKQMDELVVANSVIANQIADFSKSLQGDGNQAAGGLAKQLEQLSNQDMQMGAAIESLQTKVAALEKGKVTPAAAKPVVKKPSVVQENWVVNLVAFKQDWYARRKAEEFAAKGVPAKVSRADSKGEIWYRLVVDGFKTQYEAAAYAARVKKTLNLDSVWVAKNKN